MSMVDETRERTLSYLGSHRVMTLATHGVEGVWAAAVFYVSDGLDLLFLSAKHTRHGRNLDMNREVAATIQEEYKDWEAIQGIQLEGTVYELGGQEQDEAISLYQTKFPFVRNPVPKIATALRKVSWYRLTPGRLYFIDNSRGFGHRDELILR